MIKPTTQSRFFISSCTSRAAWTCVSAILSFITPHPVFAEGGGTVGNGGDAITGYFRTTADEVFRDLESIEAITVDGVTLDPSNVRNHFSRTLIRTTREVLIDKHGVERDALNYPHGKPVNEYPGVAIPPPLSKSPLILLSESKWLGYLNNLTDVRRLAHHELVWVAGYNDEEWLFTNRYVELTHVQIPSANQFILHRKTARQDGTDSVRGTFSFNFMHTGLQRVEKTRPFNQCVYLIPNDDKLKEMSSQERVNLTLKVVGIGTRNLVTERKVLYQNAVAYEKAGGNQELDFENYPGFNEQLLDLFDVSKTLVANGICPESNHNEAVRELMVRMTGHLARNYDPIVLDYNGKKHSVPTHRQFGLCAIGFKLTNPPPKLESQITTQVYGIDSKTGQQEVLFEIKRTLNASDFQYPKRNQTDAQVALDQRTALSVLDKLSGEHAVCTRSSYEIARLVVLRSAKLR